MTSANSVALLRDLVDHPDEGAEVRLGHPAGRRVTDSGRTVGRTS